MTGKYIEATGSSLTIDGNPPGGGTGAELYSFTAPTEAREARETTHLGSVSYKQFKPAKLKDLGEWTFVLDMDLGDDDYNDGQVHTFRLTLPLESGESTAAYWEFTGFVTSQDYGAGEVDGVMRTTIVAKPDGTTYNRVPAA